MRIRISSIGLLCASLLCGCAANSGHVPELLGLRDSFQKQHYADVTELNNKCYAAYEKFKLTNDNHYSNTKVKLSIKDLSGFYNNSISTDKLVKIEQPKLTWDTVKTDDYAFLLYAYNSPSYKPSIPDIKKAFESTMAEKKLELQNKLVECNKTATEKESTLLVKNISDKSNINGYSISVEAPESIDVSKSAEIPVTLIVESKNFFGIYPQVELTDKNVELKFDGEMIMLLNRTKNFIQVKSLSAYYNGIISTETTNIELAPESKTNYTGGFSSSFQQSSNYLNLTSTIAKNKNINFGFAVKYHLVEQNIDKTLYKTNDYNLFKVLSAKHEN